MIRTAEGVVLSIELGKEFVWMCGSLVIFVKLRCVILGLFCCCFWGYEGGSVMFYCSRIL